MPENAERYTHRAKLLVEAAEIITKDRNKSYGEPDEDFQRIAAIASAMGFRALKTVERSDGDTSEFVPLTGSDVARFMIALKLSRLAWNPTHRDSWLDTAGYAACGYETAKLEEERRTPTDPPAELYTDRTLNIRDAANKASIGAPQDLERLGMILVDKPGEMSLSCWGSCELFGSTPVHSFVGGCKYRIHHRRVS